MPNTYTWNIAGLQCLPSNNGQQNVVSTITYIVEATNGVYYAKLMDTQPVTYTAGSPFTPYASLTSAQVLTWLQTILGTNGINEIQAKLDAMIANFANPPIVTLALPWGA